MTLVEISNCCTNINVDLSQEAGHTVAKCHQPSSCGTLSQLHRQVLVKDDNYVTHMYAVLDARRQPSSKGAGFVSLYSWPILIVMSAKTYQTRDCGLWIVPALPVTEGCIRPCPTLPAFRVLHITTYKVYYSKSGTVIITLRARTSEAAAQCIVIARLFVCLWVCYYDNSKLRALILTKLDL